MAHLDQRGVGIPLDLRRTGDLLFSGRGGDGHRRGRGNGKGGPGRPGDLSGRHVLYVEDQQGREEALSVWVGGDAAATPLSELGNERKVRSAHPT